MNSRVNRVSSESDSSSSGNVETDQELERERSVSDSSNSDSDELHNDAGINMDNLPRVDLEHGLNEG